MTTAPPRRITGRTPGSPDGSRPARFSAPGARGMAAT